MTLLHGGFNVWGQFIAVHPAETGGPLARAVMVAVVALVAGVLLIVYGPRTLRESPSSSVVNK
ncbi:hypothetical protein [Halogeometricum borinquense]|uniref:hypothetical protein n=1 Tax=Halogeometricum borinquense TaxID=60847 RepID=UPI00341ACB23